jgi:transcription antitermination factor NusB
VTDTQQKHIKVDQQDELEESLDGVVEEDDFAEPTDPNTPSDSHNDDPRHMRRIQLMQHMFAYSFYQDDEQKKNFIMDHPEIAEVIPQLGEIDKQVQQLAPERPIQEINKVDLAILRIVMFEWKTSKTPKKVLIDEGVELAKEFGTESSPRFVNGVLGQLFT